MEIKIKSLEPELIDDFFYFFDNVAFTDNPGWSVCYCHFHHFNGTVKEWSRRTGEENRNASKQLILSGKMNGYLAYLDNHPVGWCKADLKDDLPMLLQNKELDIHFDGKLGAVVCFIIAYDYRRQGIAGKLLQYVCSDFKDKDYDCIEAYPRKGDKLSDAHQYHGPLSLFDSEGFSIYKEFKKFYIVRKYL